MQRNGIVLTVIGVLVLVGLVLAANLGSGPAASGGWGGGAASAIEMQADFNARQEAYRAMSNMQQMQHDTSMTIIHNMGNGACRIGVDPNCQ
ncbi:MAG: hypothetical protein EP329_21155 [Deltaproteobacteria bacterium]|nr:MAG: hypothetical protein EP329_21155 [Deltaproteobacteria bacterium]